MDRKERLQMLSDEFHHCKYADYDDTFAEFAATYGLKWGDDRYAEDEEGEQLELETDPPLPIPRYAYTNHDETYSMVNVADTIEEALAGVTGSVGSVVLDAVIQCARLCDCRLSADRWSVHAHRLLP